MLTKRTLARQRDRRGAGALGSAHARTRLGGATQRPATRFEGPPADLAASGRPPCVRARERQRLLLDLVRHELEAVTEQVTEEPARLRLAARRGGKLHVIDAEEHGESAHRYRATSSLWPEVRASSPRPRPGRAPRPRSARPPSSPGSARRSGARRRASRTRLARGSDRA